MRRCLCCVDDCGVLCCVLCVVGCLLFCRVCCSFLCVVCRCRLYIVLSLCTARCSSSRDPCILVVVSHDVLGLPFVVCCSLVIARCVFVLFVARRCLSFVVVRGLKCIAWNLLSAA